MKKYQKKKSVKKVDKKDDPNASGVKYRTPSGFRNNFNPGAGNKGGAQVRFNPGSFKVQHKG